MWYNIVSQIDTAAALLLLGAAGAVARFPMMAIGGLMAATGLPVLVWNEMIKARKLQAQWDAERARWDGGIRIRR